MTAVQQDIFETIEPHVLQTDADRLITVRTAEAVLRLRREMVASIWKDRGFPRCADLKRETLDPATSGFAAAQRYERLTIDMEAGFRSVAYCLEPRHGNGRLMVVHQGHDHEWRASGVGESAELFLERGYSVLA